MDFDLDIVEETDEQKELDRLWKIYNDLGFNDFDTWNKNDDEVMLELRTCIENNKSHEKIYGDDEIKEEIDY